MCDFVAKVYLFTKRQLEILENLRSGSVKVVSGRLGICPSTIYSHLRIIRAKIREANRVGRKYRREIYRKKRR